MRRGRAIVGGVGLLLVVVGFAWATAGLHDFGHGSNRYARIIGRATVPQRAATNAVVVTAFDFRGFDTLGEEFLLFISVVGVMVLLRSLRSEETNDEEEVASPGPRGSESARWLGAALVDAITVLGAYIVTHGHLTPGGGFQGGVVLTAAIASIFVGGEYIVLIAVRGSAKWLDMADALGAAGFALIGFGGLVAAGVFFQNFIDKGESGLLTGGVIPLANISVGIEVAGAVLMVLAELVDQRLLVDRDVSIYPYLVAVWLFGVGLWGVINSRNYIHLIICLMVVQASTYVLLLAIGYVDHGEAPIFAGIPTTSRIVDPVVQALTLTDVVVEATVVALLLALVIQADKRYGSIDPDKIVRMHD